MTFQRRGFTLVEILVVLAIMAILAGMILQSAFKRDERAFAVTAAADQLAATFRRAKVLALREGRPFAVVFNIQNTPGSSGAVLSNRDGGHWYRLMGPVPGTTSLPNPGSESSARLNPRYTNFTNALETIRSCWVAPPEVLQPGKVRFLALSDTDEGEQRWEEGTRTDTTGTWAAAPYAPTYPRPWFGFYDGTTWYPWGGYKPSIPGSGFSYQGRSSIATDYPAVVGCRNPVDYVVDHNEDADGSGGITAPSPVPAEASYQTEGRWDRSKWEAIGRPERTRYAVFRQGQPRALVNADWMDYYLAFLPDGTVQASPFGYFRSYRRDTVAVTDYCNGSGSTCLRGGVGDGRNAGGTFDYDNCPGMLKKRSFTNGNSPFQNYAYRGDDFSQNWTWPIQHFKRYTGGWYVTLGPDAASDSDQFPSAKAALDQLLPARRVFVSANGDIRIIQVKREHAWRSGGTPWPAAAADWQDLATLRKQCIYGNLHPDAPASNEAMFFWGKFRRYAGTAGDEVGPVTDWVTDSMLTGRQWWINE